ncbi:hypothetical protein C8F01DRAFT_1122956 [Mycena amicta]|nr:hypothetical protein C8F01DRAFT_1122956 [Mycena amicta]
MSGTPIASTLRAKPEDTSPPLSSSESSSISSSTSSSVRDRIAYPATPPSNFDLSLVPSTGNKFVLPHLTGQPLSIDDQHVEQAVAALVKMAHRCDMCAENELGCDHREPGIPCSICFVTGHEDCAHANADIFLGNLVTWRDAHVRRLADHLFNLIDRGQLHEHLFATHYFIGLDWARRIAQGVILRFENNRRASTGLARNGFRQLFAAAHDIAHLARFVSFAAESGAIDSSVIMLAAARIHRLAGSALQ